MAQENLLFGELVELQKNLIDVKYLEGTNFLKSAFLQLSNREENLEILSTKNTCF